MAIEIKTLSRGLLKSQPQGFQLGEGVLYAAPHSAESFGATQKRAALVTSMRFYNRNPSSVITPVTFNLYFVRYNSAVAGAIRPKRRVLPLNLSMVSGQVVSEEIPLTLEEGDAILGDASQTSVIDYVIHGIERDVI